MSTNQIKYGLQILQIVALSSVLLVASSGNAANWLPSEGWLSNLWVFALFADIPLEYFSKKFKWEEGEKPSCLVQSLVGLSKGLAFAGVLWYDWTGSISFVGTMVIILIAAAVGITLAVLLIQAATRSKTGKA